MEAPKSPFKGLNPYLMSFLQTVGTAESPSTFPSFQLSAISHISNFLNEVLPEKYIALIEDSLQFRGAELQENDYKTPEASQNAMPLVFDLALVELKTWKSVLIRRFDFRQKKHEAAIVRIEVLNPSNMLNTSYAELYQQNRQKTIESGCILIEIDYLHEYRSPIPNMPLYPHHPQAKAYNIALTNIKTEVYFWGINEAIPPILIPLKGEDSIVFDFNAPYQYTWENSRFWFYLDYQKDPERMNSYSPEDQELIRQVTKEISA